MKLLSEQTPARFVAFDLLALDDVDYTQRPFAERRAALEEALSPRSSRRSTSPRPRPTEPRPSSGSHQFEGAGLDGVIAKPLDRHLRARQADHVQGQARTDRRLRGGRLPGAQERPGPHRVAAARSLQRRRRTGQRRRHRRVPRWRGARSCSTRCSRWSRRSTTIPWAWAKQEEGSRTPRNSEGSRWNDGKDLSFVPLRPERVVEVRYDHMEGVRFRHTAQFVRWRPDRDPRSCTYEQLEEPVKFDLAEILSITPGMSTSASVERGVPEE